MAVRGARALVCTALAIAIVYGQPAPVHRIIFDTDFALPPQDDGLALAFALNSPELEILGITTVAGNYNVQRANADALRMLEIVGRTDIPVYAGASKPLAHEPDTYAKTHYGKWWTTDGPLKPPGGFAKIALQQERAADFIARTVRESPRQIEILAIGPLTNIATAIKSHSDFGKAVKHVTIMGGAIASL